MNVDTRSEWKPVSSLYDEKTAHIIASLLTDEGVASRVTAVPQLMGESHVWEVYVQDAMFERAQHLLAHARFTDAELEYLATGVLVGDPI